MKVAPTHLAVTLSQLVTLSLGPSTHTCLGPDAYLAGTWLDGGVDYGGQLNLRDSLGADTGKIVDLHLLWLEGGGSTDAEVRVKSITFLQEGGG